MIVQVETFKTLQTSLFFSKLQRTLEYFQIEVGKTDPIGEAKLIVTVVSEAVGNVTVTEVVPSSSGGAWPVE